MGNWPDPFQGGAYNLQVEGKIKNIKLDQKTKKHKGIAKSCETREVPYTCRYTSEH